MTVLDQLGEPRHVAFLVRIHEAVAEFIARFGSLVSDCVFEQVAKDFHEQLRLGDKALDRSLILGGLIVVVRGDIPSFDGLGISDGLGTT